MRRMLLPLILTLAGGFAVAAVIFNERGKLSSEELAPIERLVDVEVALEWREEAEIAASPYQDPEAALRDGFVSMESLDFTIWEHLINWPAIEDGVIMDPKHPEGLLYKVEDGKWTLMAEVFLLPLRYNYSNTPNIADGAGIWHTHPTLCLIGDPMKDPSLGIFDPGCGAGLNMPATMMVHAWVHPNACGPFAAALVTEENLASIADPLVGLDRVSGLDENGSVPGCEPELAERVWPGITN